MSDLFEGFNTLEVPAPQQFSTSSEESAEIERITTEYLFRAVAVLGLGERALSSFLKIELRMLSPVSHDLCDPRVSDDYERTLWLVGAQPLVSVMNVRNDYNGQVILFSKYQLLPKSQDRLGRIKAVQSSL